MPKKTDATAPNVLGYALPDSDRGAIERDALGGREGGPRGQRGLVRRADAKDVAAALAGASAVNLPYFFVGDTPIGVHDEDSNETWPKHRRGGQVFLGNWLAGLGKTVLDLPEGAGKAGLKAAAQKAADEADAKPGNGPQPTDAETVEALQKSHAELETRYQEAVQRADAGQERADKAEEKLKAERATTRALRKELKETQEHADGVERASNKLAQRIDTQKQTIDQICDARDIQRLALRRILDRALVAYQVASGLQFVAEYDNGRRDHILAELKSIRSLAKLLLPGQPEAQRDGSLPPLS